MSLKAIVVDDSTLFRKVVRDCLSELPGVEVIDVARNGAAGLEKIIRMRPDLVTLDVEMPQLDGLQVLEALQQEQIDTNVIMVSSHTERGAATTTRALQIGAFDFILKPNHESAEDNLNELRSQLSTRIDVLRRRKRTARDGDQPSGVGRGAATVGRWSSRRFSGAKVQRPERGKPHRIRTVPEAEMGTPAPESPEQGRAIRRSSRQREFDLICIGISTGGPKALSQLIPAIRSDFDIPILVVQHMPPFFTASMATSLDARSGLTVVEAEDKMRLSGGTVYVAPGGKQMRVGGTEGAWTVEVTDDPAVKNCKPSVDYLFDSAAKRFGKRMLAVVMTGMGSDGLCGSRSVRATGGTVWAQDKETSTVYGMPRAVADAGLVDDVFSLDALSLEIDRCTRGAKRSSSKATSCG